MDKKSKPPVPPKPKQITHNSRKSPNILVPEDLEKHGTHPTSAAHEVENSAMVNSADRALPPSSNESRLTTSVLADCPHTSSIPSSGSDSVATCSLSTSHSSTCSPASSIASTNRSSTSSSEFAKSLADVSNDILSSGSTENINNASFGGKHSKVEDSKSIIEEVTLRPLPRTKKLLKSKKYASNTNDKEASVTVREKEVSATDKRSSKPPQGAFMSALGDLLSSSGGREISIKRSSRRPTPRPRSKSVTEVAEGEESNLQTVETSKSSHNVYRSERAQDSPTPKPRNSKHLHNTLKESPELNQDKNSAAKSMSGGGVTDVPVDDQSKGDDLSKVNSPQLWRGRQAASLLDHAKFTPIANKNTPVSRTNSSPLVRNNQKIKPNRPTAPPPAIPLKSSSPSASPSLSTSAEGGKRKLVPSRPPPPVPATNTSDVPAPCRGNIKSATTASDEAKVISENFYCEISECIYDEAEGSEDNAFSSSNLQNSSASPQPPLPLPPDLPNPDNSNLATDPEPDEYMVPVSKKEEWPDSTAPSPNKNNPGPPAKSDTLQSMSSNVYEDLDSSSEDDARNSFLVPSEDVYSDYVDETFENEDSVQGGSSSESEAESEETADEKLAKRKAKLFNVAKEIVTSEREFLDKLVLLNIDFRKFVSDKSEEHGETIIPASSMNKILHYLPQITEINVELLKDFEERLENWDDQSKIADVFVTKGPFLRLYTTYISNFQTMTSELDEAVKDYPLFAEALKDFEKSERCCNLQLRHYMLKPVQRIPQYRLLLIEYQKYLEDDSPDREDTQVALKVVSEVAGHANEAMKQHDAQQSMLELQNLLIGQFTVIEPSRSLVKRGDVHKQSRKELQSRTLFLFNDYLVITTSQPNGYYKINYVLALRDMQVKKQTKEEFQKEFTIISKKKSFTSVTNTAKERDDWVKTLEDTINENERKLGTYRQGLMESTGSREYVLGEVAPVWIPDKRVTMCMKCNVSFTTFNRRHHCRACGQVLCGACSALKAPLKYLDNKQDRVCEACYDKLLEAATQSSLKLKVPGFSVKTRQTVRASPRLKPKVLQEVHANDEGEISGYMNVQNKKKQWEQYWFVIKDKVLYRYKACEDTSAIDSKPLLGYKVSKISTSSEGFDKSVMFRLDHDSTNISAMVFKIETESTADRWIETMTESTKA